MAGSHSSALSDFQTVAYPLPIFLGESTPHPCHRDPVDDAWYKRCMPRLCPSVPGLAIFGRDLPQWAEWCPSTPYESSRARMGKVEELVSNCQFGRRNTEFSAISYSLSERSEDIGGLEDESYVCARHQDLISLVAIFPSLLDAGLARS